jgi:hypothetical protein
LAEHNLWLLAVWVRLWIGLGIWDWLRYCFHTNSFIHCHLCLYLMANTNLAIVYVVRNKKRNRLYSNSWLFMNLLYLIFGSQAHYFLFNMLILGNLLCFWQLVMRLNDDLFLMHLFICICFSVGLMKLCPAAYYF